MQMSKNVNNDVSMNPPIEIWQGYCTLRNIPDGTHFDVAMVTCSVSVPSALKSNITICSHMGQNIQFKMLRGDSMKMGLAYILAKYRYFALLNRKW